MQILFPSAAAASYRFAEALQRMIAELGTQSHRLCFTAVRKTRWCAMTKESAFWYGDACLALNAGRTAVH